MYHFDAPLQKSWIADMGVKISFTDFPSIYENLTFKSRANESIRWFCILSFGSIWPSFEVRRRSFYAPLFLLVQKKIMVTLIDRKSKTSIFSTPSMDSKIGSYGTVSGDKNTKIDDKKSFFPFSTTIWNHLLCVYLSFHRPSGFDSMVILFSEGWRLMLI